MGWFGRLFGTQDAINNVIDKENGLLTQVGGWVGNMNYTDEEKAEAAAETRKWGLEQLKALEPFKVVQRVIAFMTTGMWAFVGINIVAALWIKAITHGSIDAAEGLIELAFSDYIFWPVVAVLSLYMSGGVLPQLFGKSKGVKQQ